MNVTMKASVFKAKCLQVMDEVARTGKTVVVTKNGVPVAELRPVTGPAPSWPFGWHRGQLQLHGDIIEPVGESLWEALP